MNSTSTRWNTLRDDLRERRERRVALRRLHQDLATYRTPSDVEDLLVALDTQEAAGKVGDEAALIRQILQANLSDYYARQSTLRVVGL